MNCIPDRRAAKWAKGILLVAGFSVFLAPCPLLATLIISIYHGNELYIAGDSLLVTHAAGEEKRLHQKKVFKIDKTCCVAISGLSAQDFIKGSTGEKVPISFNKTLEQISLEMS